MLPYIYCIMHVLKTMESPKTPKDQMIPPPSTPNTPMKQGRFTVSVNRNHNTARNLSAFFESVATKK